MTLSHALMVVIQYILVDLSYFLIYFITAIEFFGLTTWLTMCTKTL